MYDRYVIVEGENPDQANVRPHNWAERFAGNLATYGEDRRLRFSDAVVPVMINNVKCLRVERTLAEQNPALFRDILGFAETHSLKVHGLSAANSDEMAIAS